MIEYYLLNQPMTNGQFKGWLPDILKSVYLNRYAWPGPLVNTPTEKNTRIIVVIPCFNETEIMESLESLETCERPTCNVEIIVVVNHGANADASVKSVNIQSASKVQDWIGEPRKYQYHLIRAFDLPPKKAGVGLARKIGMDEAVRRFDEIGEKKGIIACFDADCTCSSNYLVEIERIYLEEIHTNAALVYFEHDINSFKIGPRNKTAIINYELHLRYYVQALKYAKFPYSFHTVGSCITVASGAYQKQGGMNLKKAGEDFYFLQRIFPLGHIINLSAAKIIPSSRPSDRVPFGTGKAVGEMLKNDLEDYSTYNPNIFVDFQIFNMAVLSLYHMPQTEDFTSSIPVSFHKYLKSIDFTTQVIKIKKNSKNPTAFYQSFYNWFNGFKALKYVHYARDNYYPNVEVFEAVNWVLNHRLERSAANKTEALSLMRTLDRSE